MGTVVFAYVRMMDKPNRSCGRSCARHARVVLPRLHHRRRPDGDHSDGHRVLQLLHDLGGHQGSASLIIIFIVMLCWFSNDSIQSSVFSLSAFSVLLSFFCVHVSSCCCLCVCRVRFFCSFWWVLFQRFLRVFHISVAGSVVVVLLLFFFSTVGM